MKMTRSILSTLFLAASLGLYAPAIGQELFLLKEVIDQDSSYCHMQFTTSEGDVVDFYGPCDYDPLSREELATQISDQIMQDNDDSDD